MQGFLSKRMANRNAQQAHKKMRNRYKIFLANQLSQTIICCKWRHILFHRAVLSISKVSLRKGQMCCKQGIDGNEQRHDEAVWRRAKMTVAQLRKWDSDQRLTVTARGLKAKFKAPNLRQKLVGTGSCFFDRGQSYR